MITSIRKLFQLLGPGELARSFYLFFGMLILAVFEVLGIGSILPFLTALSNPQIIMENEWLNFVYNYLKFNSTNQFLFLMGLFILFVFLAKNISNALLLWVKYRFIYHNNSRLAKRLVRAYFSMPYEFFLNSNTSNHRKNILSEVNNVVMKFLFPLLTLVAQGLVAIFIIALIILVDPLLSLIISAVLGIPYLLIYLLIKKKVATLGIKRIETNQARFKILNQAFGGIKDLKVFGKEAYFTNAFSSAQEIFSTSQANINVLTNLPQFFVETLAVGGVLAILLYLISIGRDIKEILPLVALYALSAKRLIPALQQIVASISQLNANRHSLNVLLKDFKDKEQYFNAVFSPNDGSSKLLVEKEIKLSHIAFNYTNERTFAIDNLNLKIPRNASIALVGLTGSGKSTLVDIILGLLKPQKGTIKVDNQLITGENKQALRNNIGYVPQQIYLTDDTVTRNIAFGIPDKSIDTNAVEKASRLSFLYNFITEELPDGFNTFIGEKGVRMSGGQRQRIGLARALYNNPNILILDEATSNLDRITETKINDTINKLSGQKTIIIIAHRLSTVKSCDMIYLIEKGKIVDEGKYQELKENNKMFKAMI